MRELIKIKKHFIKEFVRLLFPSLIIFTVFMVMIFSFLVPIIEKKHFQNKEDQCRYLVEIIINYLTSLNSDITNGTVTETAAKKRAIERIRGLRFGNETKDYFWILNSKGVFLMHPFRRDVENVDPEKVTGPDGQILVKLMRRMSYIANSKPEGGTISYVWDRRDEIGNLGKKISYVKKFPPWDWIVGTGVYIDEAENEIRSWKILFSVIATLLALLATAVSLVLSLKAENSRKKEEDARMLLLESEKNLRVRERLFRSIFEKSPHGIVITDMQSRRIINANHAFYEISGYSKEIITSDVSYRNIQTLSSEEYEKFHAGITLCGAIENRNSFLITNDKKKKDIIYSAILINYLDEDSILRMIVDVTEERLLEDKLRHSQKMDVVGRLTGGIAHDFNNMLGVIIGSAELLSLKQKTGVDENKYITRILDTGEKASDLIRKLMLFSRKSGAVFRTFDVHDTVINVTDILEHTIDKKIKIEMELKAAHSIINGDPPLIENALLNMALNSRDAMPDGGKISFSTKNAILDEHFAKNNPLTITPGYFIEINISDTGEGIPPENIDKIFEPFFTTKPSGKGTGLGLAAVYGTVKEHKGTIAIYSEQGKGSVFKIYIPCISENHAVKKDPEFSLIPGSETILIIDDDINILSNLKDLLEELGYTVFSASGGMEGITSFRENFHLIDLVIVDMIMPEIDGAETISHLQKIKPDIKIVISSGFNYEDSSGRISNTEISGSIQKPFRIHELSQLLDSILHHK